METTNPTPRVNYELLQQHIGKRVKLVCKIDRTEDNKLVVKAADGGTVFIIPSGKSNFDGQVIEVEGVVESPNSLREMEVCSFGGDEFDMATYNELVKMSNGTYSYLFV